MVFRKIFFAFALFFCSFTVFSQQKAILYGTITDEKGNGLEGAHVKVVQQPQIITSTNKSGKYKLEVPATREITIAFTHVSFSDKLLPFNLKPGENYEHSVSMKEKAHQYSEFEIKGQQEIPATMQKIDPKIVQYVPSASGHFEAILFSQPGVSSNNELSSQYSVRGGNFDENLVYVNGIQVYRPFLVRAGQQEGLSFINSDLVESILFSAGGFEAKYGDKMSSVLDITYKEPTKFAGSVSGSLLGAAVHVEDASKDYRFTQIHGLRYHTNQYVLGALETTGSYKPSFTDYQGYFTYDISDELELGFLANFSQNKYNFIPETQQTDFGNINQALRLTVYFDGQEVDKFTTYFGAFTANYRPTHNMSYQFTTSAFKTSEEETFDILGQYWLDELERDLGDDEFGEVAFNRGVGSYLHHARNYLDALVYNAEIKGQNFDKNNTLLWGLKYQYEDIQDELSEWKLLDSAGYSLPNRSDSVGYIIPSLQPEQTIELSEVHKSQNHIQSNRISGYIQENLQFYLADTSKITLTGGTRFNYWSFNRQLLFSPRATISFQPKKLPNTSFRFASGYYQQPPFYREMRDLNGNINTDIKAQTSIHFVLGSDYFFKAWGRPFKYTAEGYYKILENLIPYELDNVRIRYYATNNSKGDAMGVDMKVHGEFVKGVDSWASLSVMRIREDIVDDYYYEYYNASGEKIISGFTFDQVATDSVKFEPGYIPRPTDQRVNFGLFFQDYIPKNPNFKMHLNLLYGTGLPFGPPSFERYKDTLRIPPYRRVDIGFSAQLLSEKKKLRDKNPFRFLKSIWASLEVFNLLEIDNTISYIWIKDVTNRQYAVPNHLTSRRINAKLIFRF